MRGGRGAPHLCVPPALCRPRRRRTAPAAAASTGRQAGLRQPARPRQSLARPAHLSVHLEDEVLKVSLANEADAHALEGRGTPVSSAGARVRLQGPRPLHSGPRSAQTRAQPTPTGAPRVPTRLWSLVLPLASSAAGHAHAQQGPPLSRRPQASCPRARERDRSGDGKNAGPATGAPLGASEEGETVPTVTRSSGDKLSSVPPQAQGFP